MGRPKKTALVASGGTTAKAQQTESIEAAAKHRATGLQGGAQAVPHYRDRHEEYMLVTKDDLREIRALGWLQQTLFGAGTFFFSGAFWLLAELMSHQEHFEFTAWMGMCVISILAGLIVAAIGLILFGLRQKRLDKYF
jgi:hypothetical protein